MAACLLTCRLDRKEKSKLIGFEHDAPDGPIGKLGNLAAPSCAAPCISDRRFLTRPAAAPRPLLDRTEFWKSQDKVESCKGARHDSAGRCAGDCSWLKDKPGRHGISPAILSLAWQAAKNISRVSGSSNVSD